MITLNRIKKCVLVFLIGGVIILIVCLVSNCKILINDSNNLGVEINTSENSEISDIQKEESQEDINLNNKEENSDDNGSIEKISKYMIPEQSFDIFLDGWGDVTFISCKPSPNELKDWKVASFYLVKDNQILYKFPYRFENNSSKGYIGIFDSVGAVAFHDLNNDKKDDIIIITYYVSGAGPTGMVSRPGVTIYLAGENEFYLAEEMMTNIEKNIIEQDRTIANIYDFLQRGE